MKTPLRFQVTEFDCGTISLLNAISYLFEREEIPAELIRAIHEYTLDCYDEKGNLGQGGTSVESVRLLTHWITYYANTHDFHIHCEHLQGEEVNAERMEDCLKKKGCVYVRCWQLCEHYVIVTKMDKKKVYLFDPYYLDKEEYKKDRQVKIVFRRPFTHNRVVTRRRFFGETKKDFSLGPKENRECVLMERTK